MSEVTTDPNDPRLGRGVDDKPVSQNDAYLVLGESSEHVRPLRKAYIHVGHKPKHPLRILTPEETERYSKYGYVAYEQYPESEHPITGCFWSQESLDAAEGCNAVTTLAHSIASTYAANPNFYSSTYCVGCSRHRPLNEFVWQEDGEVVGS